LEKLTFTLLNILKNLLLIIGSNGSLNLSNIIAEKLINSNINTILITTLNIKDINTRYYKRIIFENTNIKKNKINKYLNKYKSKTIFVGSGGYGFFESSFLLQAKKNNILTFCILDSWSHPLERFKSNKNKYKFLFPDYLGVPFSSTKLIINEKKNDIKKLIVLGLPHLVNTAIKFSKCKIKLKYDLNLLYISSPLIDPKPFKLSKDDIRYNQQKIFDNFISYFIKFSANNKIKVNIGVKLHPLEIKKNKFLEFNHLDLNKWVKIYYEDQIKKHIMFKKYNAVFGISSTILIESIYCNIPTFSLQTSNGFNKKNNYFKKIPKLNIIKNINEISCYENKIFTINNNRKIKHYKYPELNKKFSYFCELIKKNI
tara:strand:- start:2119 stop:3231 length:1113 start_codon:yes stop_codon:yes gene_type:complete